MLEQASSAGKEIVLVSSVQNELPKEAYMNEQGEVDMGEGKEVKRRTT